MVEKDFLHFCLSMKLKYANAGLALLLGFLLSACGGRQESWVVPQPQKVEFGRGYFDAGPLAEHSSRFRKQLDTSLHQPESYRLRVERDSVILLAADSAGLFYGQQTLQQLTRSDGRIPVPPFPH